MVPQLSPPHSGQPARPAARQPARRQPSRQDEEVVGLRQVSGTSRSASMPATHTSCKGCHISVLSLPTARSVRDKLCESHQSWHVLQEICRQASHRCSPVSMCVGPTLLPSPAGCRLAVADAIVPSAWLGPTAQPCMSSRTTASHLAVSVRRLVARRGFRGLSCSCSAAG